MANREKKVEKVTATNCYNCKFVATQDRAIDTQELNNECGIDQKIKT